MINLYSSTNEWKLDRIIVKNIIIVILPLMAAIMHNLDHFFYLQQLHHYVLIASWEPTTQKM